MNAAKLGKCKSMKFVPIFSTADAYNLPSNFKEIKKRGAAIAAPRQYHIWKFIP